MRRRIEGFSSSSGSVPSCSHEVDGCLERLLRSEVAPSDINICESGNLEGNDSSTSIGHWVNGSLTEVNGSYSSASNAFYEAGSDKFIGCFGKS